jgi:hypothetical protein
LITQRGLIRDVARSWHEHYGDKWDGFGEDKTEIYRKLLALDRESCSAGDVKAIIGNSSWTRIECNGCGVDVEIAVSVGQEPDYESRTAVLCRPCVEAALALFPRPTPEERSEPHGITKET